MKKQRNVIAVSILAVILLGLAFFQTPIMAQLRGVAWDGWVRTVGQVLGLGTRGDLTTVSEQNASLRAENIRLRAELADYRRLRDQISNPAVDDLRSIPAAVVGRPLDTWQSRYIINKGIDDGVVIGAPAVINGSILIGFVREIHAESAVIELLYHPSTSITAETLEEDEEKQPARGLLESRHYTSLWLTTVPRDVELLAGQQIVAAGREQTLPYGLIVGEVDEVRSQENEAYQQARIKTSYDLDSIQALHVLVQP